MATNFPSSSDDAIIIDDIDAPENKSPMPHMEKKAAHVAINNAENPSKLLKFKIGFITCISIKLKNNLIVFVRCQQPSVYNNGDLVPPRKNKKPHPKGWSFDI